MYGVDGGLQKAFFDNKLTAKVSVSDMFRTMKWSGESRFAGVYAIASGYWESRQLKLSLSYRFGSNQIKASTQRKTGIDDESKRANGGTGQGGMGNQ
jgi:iron complex outermembrane recepter protein